MCVEDHVEGSRFETTEERKITQRDSDITTGV